MSIARWMPLVLMASLGSVSLAQNASVLNQSTASADLKAKKSWEIIAAGDQYFGMRDDAESVSVFYFIGSYDLSFGRLQVFQPGVKYYEVDPGEEEFQPGDTALRYFSPSYSFVDNWKFRYSIESTLPTSQFSQDQDVVTKPSLQAILETSVGKAYFSLRPEVRLFVNRYTTTVSEEGDGGGRPLRQSMVGATMVGAYTFTDTVSTALAASYFQVNFERTEFENEQPTLGYSDYASNQYQVDASLTTQLIPGRWSATAGYALSSTVERLGGIEFLAYDEELSTVYLSTSLVF